MSVNDAIIRGALALAQLSELPKHKHLGRAFLGHLVENMAGALTQAPSIDTYLDSHSGDPHLPMLGKIGIAACLMDYERQCTLYQPVSSPLAARVSFPRSGDTWLTTLWRILVAGVYESEIEKMFANVSFIVFNYDRCIEHFLTLSLCNYFHIPHRTAAKIVSRCRILHPYGSLGPLYSSDPLTKTIPFGHDLDPERRGLESAKEAIQIAGNIRTFSEYEVDANQQQLVKKLVAGAEHVFFLGFGFLEQNVELLRATSPTTAARVVRATAYDESPSNQYHFAQDIRRILRMPIDEPIGVAALTCNALVRGESQLLSR